RPYHPPLHTPLSPRYPLSFPTRRSSDLEVTASSIRFPQQCVRKLHSEFSCHALVQHNSLDGDLFNRQVARPLSEQDASRQLGSGDRKSTRLNSSHEWISYAVFCLKKKTH